MDSSIVTTRQARPVHNKAPLNTSERIRAHKRAYWKIARASRLCKTIPEGGADNKQTDTAQLLHSLADIRISINNGNGAFTTKESKQTQTTTRDIYNDFCTCKLKGFRHYAWQGL